MKNIKYGGRTVKPRLIVGEDVKTKECLVMNVSGDNFSAEDVTRFFMAIAKLNKKTYDEMGKLLAEAANYIEKNESFGPVTVQRVD